MRRRSGRIKLDMALSPVPEFQCDDKLVASRSELDLLEPFVGKPASLRARVNELRRYIHDLTSLPMGRED